MVKSSYPVRAAASSLHPQFEELKSEVNMRISDMSKHIDGSNKSV